MDQIVMLTQNIEYSSKKKVGALFVNLTAATDTVWHRPYLQAAEASSG